MKKNYFQVNVPLPNYGYSFGISINSDKPLTKQDVLTISYAANKFEDESDADIAEVIPISEEEYKAIY